MTEEINATFFLFFFKIQRNLFLCILGELVPSRLPIVGIGISVRL